MSQELVQSHERMVLIEIIKRRLEQALDGSALIYFPDAHGDMEIAHPNMTRAGVKEEVVVRWVYQNEEPAGLGTTTMPSARGYFVPLRGAGGTFGVLGLMPNEAGHILNPEEKDMIETFGALASAALERVNISVVAESRKIEAESERLRNALLSSVSHDLRTPLASIKGVISSLLLDGDRIAGTSRRELLTSAHDEVARLERLVSNLLDVTRLEAGEMALKRDYYFVPELAGNAIKQTQSLLAHHIVTTALSESLPAVWVDGLLIEQVLINLLENSAKYTPAGSHVAILAKQLNENWLELSLEDDGPGIAPEQTERIFDKFARFRTEEYDYGAGLGLTICRGIIQAHGGDISARNRETGGARFSFTLPIAKLAEAPDGNS